MVDILIDEIDEWIFLGGQQLTPSSVPSGFYTSRAIFSFSFGRPCLEEDEGLNCGIEGVLTSRGLGLIEHDGVDTRSTLIPFTADFHGTFEGRDHGTLLGIYCGAGVDPLCRPSSISTGHHMLWHTFGATPVPEPATAWLLIAALGAIRAVVSASFLRYRYAARLLCASDAPFTPWRRP